MAQLVKLLDYISRYESDLSRYPSQYIRLKRYQWERMKTQWENGAELTEWQQDNEETEPVVGKWFSPLFRIFGQSKETVEIEQPEPTEEDDFGFMPNIVHTPTSIEQLRKLYVDQLFHFQMKWASSTLMDKSRVEPRFMRDSLLRSFAQQLPDSYLLFYYPILLLKKAPVEIDIVIVTPVECMCITVLEQEDVSAFVGSSDRFWIKKLGENESKLLNPLIGLGRMEKIISGIFKAADTDFPIKKYLISRNGYIDFPGKAFDLTIIDRRNYEQWFATLKKSATPMKSIQFKAAQVILDVGQTTAISRLFGDEQELEE